MEIRDFALIVAAGEDLEAKLSPPPRGLTDLQPGPALRLEAPGRPPGLRIVPGRAAKVPQREGIADPRQRARILHALANHELQAVELFAWALLAFPDAPRAFREGLVDRVREEQAHVRLYRKRLEALGARLGDHPVSGYFWSKAGTLHTPLRFVCAMSLTFENANLHHTLEYAAAARAAGDEETARLLERVHRDEVEHVRFGVRWLEEWKEPGQSALEAYRASVDWPLRPALARGKTFHRRGREEAGLDEEFIRALAEADREAP